MSEEFQDFCIEQCRRMAALSYYPKGSSPEDSVARGELVKALMRVATNEDHGRWIIDKILEVRRDCPTPLDIDEIAGLIPSRREAQQSTYVGCQNCVGSPGWAHEVRMLNGVPYHYSLPCNCRARGVA